jgi:hypothetical protein
MKTISGMTAACLLLGLYSAQADELLAPGKPAGVRQAQISDMVNIYGGVVLVAGLLFAVIGTTGDPGTVSTTSTG